MNTCTSTLLKALWCWLCGGTKDTTKEQNNDISHARELLAKRSAAGIAGERTHGR